MILTFGLVRLCARACGWCVAARWPGVEQLHHYRQNQIENFQATLEEAYAGIDEYKSGASLPVCAANKLPRGAGRAEELEGGVRARVPGRRCVYCAPP